MFTDFDEERSTQQRKQSNQLQLLRIKIKYLEKDNKDHELDLEDVEASLNINKTIINTLIDARPEFKTTYKETIAGFQKEI